MTQTWFEERFVEPCPHDLVKAYCTQCLGEEWEAEREQKRREDGEKTLQGRVRSLEATVERQSKALTSAYSYIRALERRQQTRRPRRLFGGRREAQ